MSPATKKALGPSYSSSQGVIHNIPAGDTMNKTLVTVAEPSDIHWERLSVDTVVRIECHEQGCYMFGSQHALAWGDAPRHTAFIATNEPDVRIEVTKFSVCNEVPAEESGRWTVSGFLTDGTSELTPERVAYFNAHYNSAVALAAELNEAIA
jgi:hypothetical protein